MTLLLLLPGAGELRAQSTWAVVPTGKLDQRITQQLQGLARRYGAEVRYFAGADEAAPTRPRLLLELLEENDDSFFRDLKQLAGTAAAELSPELARQGYKIDASFTTRSAQRHLRITAASAVGFHNALLRLPQLLRASSSTPSAEPAPAAKFQATTRSGRTTMLSLADFPSFPERGIVEGFYGKPWSHEERLEILRFAGQRGMNVYYYAPKDDPYHRKLWREAYPAGEMKRLAELVNAARENFVELCFAISPGLSMVYSSQEDFGKLTAKLESVAQLGVSRFSLFLDDVPQELESPEDRARFKTLAEAHVDLINRLDRHLKSLAPSNRLVVTPTTYTSEWGSRDYIRELGAGVDPDVDLVWTGPRVVSPALTVTDAKEWGKLLGRPPLVWDNFPVNDGIRWRLNLGPLVGRDAKLPDAARGLLSNPMNQAHASLIPLQTIADYLWNSLAYDPKRSLRQALTDQYGEDAPRLLAPFLKTYGDYWWEENVFKPLFVEERLPIDRREIERQIARLDASLRSLRKRRRFEKLASELRPFPSQTRKRLALVRADAAFRRLPGQKLVWDKDHDALEARRVSAPAFDGDFTKWQSGRLYALSHAAQIVAGAGHWRGPGQFSARFALGWDDNYLYVGVDAIDAELYQPSSGRGIDKGDVVILTLETAFRRNFAGTQTNGDEYRLLFSPGNFSGVEPSVFSDEDYLPPRPQPRDYNREINTAWKKTPVGFSGDIAIPVGWFEGGKFQPGYEIGLSLGTQKALPPRSAGAAEEPERIIFSFKSDRLFPVRLSNPSTYQRLVLTNGQ